MTGHGFRIMASTVLHDQGWNHQAIVRRVGPSYVLASSTLSSQRMVICVLRTAMLPVNLPASIHGTAFDVSGILETWKFPLRIRP